LLSAALALALPGQAAFGRVGVASVVEGEPTGLPPGGTQRVLRVGIDMNADEKVTTKADDRAHWCSSMARRSPSARTAK